MAVGFREIEHALVNLNDSRGVQIWRRGFDCLRLIALLPASRPSTMPAWSGVSFVFSKGNFCFRGRPHRAGTGEAISWVLYQVKIRVHVNADVAERWAPGALIERRELQRSGGAIGREGEGLVLPTHIAAVKTGAVKGEVLDLTCR
jgi:hypothetical protein